MKTKLHIGNVPASTTQADLHGLFSRQGAVSEVKLVIDRAPGRTRGFAFVTMETLEGAQAALASLNGEIVRGAFITVSQSRSREESLARSSESDPTPRRSCRKLY